MFDVHDVVFARLEGYPFWPARVIPPKSEHLSSLDMSNIPPRQRLVLFYNDNGRYAAMETSDLRNFDDHRIQERTREYDGPYRAQLRIAFKEAGQEHVTKRPSPTNSPRRRRRPVKNNTAPQPTSPVTGQSEPRQSTAPNTIKLSTQLAHRATSPSDSPLQTTPRKSSAPPPIASRTNLDSSPSTHPSQSQYFSSQEHTADKKPSPPQLQPSPSVQLRLRLKRNADSLHPSSQPSQQRTHQAVPKRRRLVQTEPSNIRSHPPPKHSEKQSHYHRPAHHKPHPSIHKNRTAQLQQRRHKHISEKLIPDLDQHERIAHDPHRIPRLTNRKTPHHTDEKPKREPNNNGPTSPKSRIERNQSKHSSPDKIVRQPPHERDSDQVFQSKKRKRFSNDDAGQPDNDEIEGEPRKKEMRPASKRSSGAERPLQNLETRGGPIENGDVKGDGAENEVENRESIESERNSKAGMGVMGVSTAFDHLSKDECINLIRQLQETVRCNNVELWRRGIRLAEEKDILKTEKDLMEACSGAMQKAENVVKLMKSDGKEKKEVLEKETEAYKACNALRDVYFNVEKVELQRLGKRMVSLVKEMRWHSMKLSRSIMDVVIMWADLTDRSGTKEESKECVPKRKDNGVKGPTEKKTLAREERVQKFDRKTCWAAMEHLFRDDEDGEGLKLDEKEILGITKRLEREIRPRYEEDKVGYYRVCAKVLRGLRKVVRYVAANGEKEDDVIDDNANPPATLLMQIVKYPQNTCRDKTKLLVSELNSRK